jgi:phosphoglycolate phosphatase
VHRLAEKALALRGEALPPDAARAAAEDLAERVRARYRAHPCVDSALYPGIARTLAALRGEPALHLAVLTNKPGDVARALLEALGIAGTFEAIVGDGDGHPRKPDPAAARALMQRFGATPERTLVVGDGVPDMQIARAAGCAAAAAGWGYTDHDALRAAAPTFFVESPGDLLAVVGR